MHSPNYTPRKPQFIILHYTAGDDDASIAWLTNQNSQVSAHYLIQSHGNISNLIPEEERAWHAGKGAWRGLTDLNSASIGIEIVNYGFEGNHVPDNIDRRSCVVIPGSDKSWFPYSEKQYQSLVTLLLQLKNRWGALSPLNFMGHSDLAPGRKIDPGPLFPWERLYREYDIGAWPDLGKPLQHMTFPEGDLSGSYIIKWTQMRLRDFGYMQCPLTGDLDDQTVLTLQAFQMHFRPSNISGDLDRETIDILVHLLDQYYYN